MRIPASFCGIAGLKPTYGAVSRLGLVAHASSMDQIGPLANNVQDLTHVFEAISKRDELDATWFRCEQRTGKQVLPKQLRVGVCSNRVLQTADKQVKLAYEQLVSQLVNLGYDVVEPVLPAYETLLSAYHILSSAEAFSNLARFDGLRFSGEQCSPPTLRANRFGFEVQKRIAFGAYVLSVENKRDMYDSACTVRQVVQELWQKVWDTCHVVVMPTCPRSVPEVGLSEKDSIQLDLYTVEANLTGMPALTMPYPVKSGELPVGIQLIGPHGADYRLLALGEQLEQSFHENRVAEQL